jgi:hypothetical protein
LPRTCWCSLPDVPFDPKLLKFPNPPDHASRYNILTGSAAEAAVSQRLLADSGSHVLFPSLSQRRFAVPVPVGLFATSRKQESLGKTQQSAIQEHKERMHEDDRFITSERFAQPAAKAGEARPEVPTTDWIHHTHVFHNNLYDAVYKHAKPGELQQRTLERRIRALAREEEAKKSPVEQVEESFAEAAKWDDALRDKSLSSMLHPDPSRAKAGVHAVGVAELVPDGGRWEEDMLAGFFDEPASWAVTASGGGDVIVRQAPSWAAQLVGPGDEGMQVQALVPFPEMDGPEGEAWKLVRHLVARVQSFGAGEEHIAIVLPEGWQDGEAHAQAEWVPIKSSLHMVKARPRPLSQDGEPLRVVGLAREGDVAAVARVPLDEDALDTRKEASLHLWESDVDEARIQLHTQRAQRRMREAHRLAQSAAASSRADISEDDELDEELDERDSVPMERARYAPVEPSQSAPADDAMRVIQSATHERRVAASTAAAPAAARADLFADEDDDDADDV